MRDVHIEESYREERKANMIIDNSKFHCSLNDTSELRKLIIDNPDLPLIIFAGEESWQGSWSYNQADVHGVRIQELTLHGDMWLDRDEYEEKLADDLANVEEYAELSDEEYNKMIERKVAETPFCKAIVFYVG